MLRPCKESKLHNERHELITFTLKQTLRLYVKYTVECVRYDYCFTAIVDIFVVVIVVAVVVVLVVVVYIPVVIVNVDNDLKLRPMFFGWRSCCRNKCSRNKTTRTAQSC